MERSASEPLQCPRCSSSNTKFCYYNNYNLSQPRHFCKACKRYWTRGGTLRNVPVGGGCRKNKKFKRYPPSTAVPKKLSSLQPDIDLSSQSSNPINNPLFYSFPTELIFPFSETRVSSDSPTFDDLPRISGPGLGFSSDYRNGFQQNIQDHANCITFRSPNSTMASLLDQHQRFAARAIQTSNQFSSLLPYEDMQMVVGNGGIGKESKMFEGEIRSNQIHEQINSSSLLMNSNNVGVWFDPSLI